MYNYYMCRIFKTIHSFMSMQNYFGICTKLTKNSPKISYLMFTDDCIILCGTTKKEKQNVKDILNHYCKISSHLVSYHR